MNSDELTNNFYDILEQSIHKLCNCITDIIINYKLPITPNMITILRLILISTLLLYKTNYKLIAIIYLICRSLDNLDGILARKGKMISKIGDKLDHYTDIIETLIVLYILYFNRFNKTMCYYIIPIVLFIYLFINLSCQQIFINKNHSNENKKESIERISSFCPNCLYNNKSIFKIFGYGFSVFMMFLFLLNMQKFNY